MSRDSEFKSPSNQAPLLPVPEGLTRCPVCDEYRGTMRLGELSDPFGLYRDENPDTRLVVQCICDGIPCYCCKKNRVHRPISNVWGPRGGFGHIPYFAAQIPCNECREKKKAEEAAGLRKQSTAERRRPLLEEDEEDPAVAEEYFKAYWERRRRFSRGI